MDSNIKKFNQICKDIKSIKIQGATNVAKYGILAYSLNPTKQAEKILLNLRPTEPALANAIRLTESEMRTAKRAGSQQEQDEYYKKVLKHFDNAQKEINKLILKLIKSNSTIYTHCHSSTVTKALINAKKHKKKFEVYNTETRPLYQGRITSKELSKAKIKVTQFVDSGFHEAIPNSNIILIGADAILKKGVINKVGSATVAELAHLHKVPLYIVSDSWKFSPKNVKIEERDFHEIWKNSPKSIKIKNPAFELIKKKYIKGVISELGILSYRKFIKAAKKHNKMKIHIRLLEPKPVITFDMDLTLIKSNKCHIEAYKYMLKKLNIKKSNVNWTSIIRQKTRYEAVKLLCPEFNKKQVEQGVQLYMHHLNTKSYKFAKQEPYALKTLEALKKDFSLSIVTNCTDVNAKIMLSKGAKIPIKYFDLVVGSNDSTLVKPSARPLKKVEKILCSKILVHIGDSINDILAAHADKIPVIAVATGNHTISELKKYKPEFTVKNLKPILNIIAKITKHKNKNK